MALVDYSDSDASDAEQMPTTKLATSKSSFQKVVDRSNPGKIRVSLPQAVIKGDNNANEHPAKRAKTEGGAFSGFNSFLPPPKRTNQTNTTASADSARKPGVGPGMSLKTSSTPGFSREKEPEREYTEEEDTLSALGVSGLNLPPPVSADPLDLKPADEVKLVGKPLMFKPLSVSRKPVKKNKQATEPTSTIPHSLAKPTTQEAKVEKPAPRPKVSLFSMSTESEEVPVTTSNGEYRSIIYESGEKGGDEEEAEDVSFELKPSYEENAPNTRRMAPPAVPNPPVSQSLDDIAGDLNLTESEKRQLFGRQKGGRMQSAMKVINFNTDQEYLHNEELRAAGEQVVHNPVRSIAPGKHSLKQLVNAAQSQKDALEESFAKGKSNRAEASSRYGW